MNPMVKQALFVLAVIAAAKVAQQALPIPNAIANYLP